MKTYIQKGNANAKTAIITTPITVNIFSNIFCIYTPPLFLVLVLCQIKFFIPNINFFPSKFG